MIDKDLKSVSEIKLASEKLCQEKKLEFIHFTTFNELDVFLKEKEFSLPLMALAPETMDTPLTTETLQGLKDKYKTSLIVVAFYDPLKSFKKVETWPVENIIYKPFDQAILQDHLRFAATGNERLKPLAVHSAKENFEIEKVRRHTFTALSEFGFKIKSKSQFDIGVAYKFYHFIFRDQKRLSLWAKPIYHQNEDYEFIFCCPTAAVITQLRKSAAESKSKLKNEGLNGYLKNKDVKKVKIGLEFHSTDEIAALKSFFQRRYPDVELLEIQDDPQKKTEPLKLHLFISEKKYEKKYIQERFGNDALYFHITNELFTDRKLAEQTLSEETVRMYKPIDRHYLSRMLMCYFPQLKDLEPLPVSWFTVQEETLFSETVIAKEFSEAAFVYDRETVLGRGHYQEFALPHEDETELKPLKAKIQFSDSKAQPNKLFAHQVVFYGIRDDLLKKIRLWMLQTFISKKNSGA